MIDRQSNESRRSFLYLKTMITWNHFLLFLLTCALLFASPTQAQSRWKVLAQGNPTISVDSLSIKNSDVRESSWTQRVWVRWQYTKPKMITSLDKRTFTEVKRLEEFSCKESLSRTHRIFWYNASGNVVKNYEASSPEWTENVPDTVGEVSLRQFCKWIGTFSTQ